MKHRNRPGENTPVGAQPPAMPQGGSLPVPENPPVLPEQLHPENTATLGEPPLASAAAPEDEPLKPEVQPERVLAGGPVKRFLKQLGLDLERSDRSLMQARHEDLNEEWEREKKREGSRRRVRRRFWAQVWTERLWLRRLVAVSVVVFGITSFLLLPQFYVNEITIKGLHTITPEAVLEASGIKQGQHMLRGLGGSLEGWLRLRYTSAERAVKRKLPYVESIEIRPHFPGGMTMTVQERIGVAYIRQEDSVLVVDSEGVVLRVEKQAPKGLPLIEGIVDSRVEVGRPIDQAFRNAITSTVMILSTIIDTDREANDHWDFFGRILRIRQIDSFTHFLTVELNNGRKLYVKLGALNEMRDNLYWLRAILKMGELDKLPDGLLDLSGKQRIFLPGKNFSVVVGQENGPPINIPQYNGEGEPPVATFPQRSAPQPSGSEVSEPVESGAPEKAGKPEPPKPVEETPTTPTSGAETEPTKPTEPAGTLPVETFPEITFG